MKKRKAPDGDLYVCLAGLAWGFGVGIAIGAFGMLLLVQKGIVG